MILERIYNLAIPGIVGSVIKDVRIGLELLAVELDSGKIGVTYVLKNEAGHICQSFSQAGRLIGMKAEEVGKWAIAGEDVISRALGLAVLNSAVDMDTLSRFQGEEGQDAVDSVDLQPGETVGIIGRIGPVISRLKGRENQLLIFERDANKSDGIYPESLQYELLPRCQIVFITSSAIINGTLDNVLSYCTNARSVVMVGSSTPMYPQAFTGTGVTVLSGTLWPSENGSAILNGVSQCAGMKQLIRYGRKVSVKVE